MAPIKFAIKCGNFAVLVDLHVLPLGGQEDTSWFPTGYIKEVAALVRDAVDERVKQYTESLYNKKQPKQKKELAPASAFFVKGKNFSLAANFLKRHFNLRCVPSHLYGDLRVFPERYVVCVSYPEDASTHHGNPSLGVTELSEQSRSEYFSRVRETQEPSNSLKKTTKSALQKIVRQASVQQDISNFSSGEKHIVQSDIKGERRVAKTNAGETMSSSEQEDLPEAGHEGPCPTAISEAMIHIQTTGKQSLIQEQQAEFSLPDSINPKGASVGNSDIIEATRMSKRCKPIDAGEDPHPQRAKRTCLGRTPSEVQTHSTEFSTHKSKHDLLPLLPIAPVEAMAESKAFPVIECKKTTLEVELLTPGKRAQRLPLTSNNTAQTNQNRLAASLRGLSVKPASSCSSISSRSTLKEEGGENVPRTSRLRRLKKS